jgi:malonate decarboxylase beta subunit
VADFQTLLAKQSFIELSARERAKALLDENSFRELLDPFAHDVTLATKTEYRATSG